jgi:hypothetical protein
MPPARFELAMPGGERPQTHALGINEYRHLSLFWMTILALNDKVNAAICSNYENMTQARVVWSLLKPVVSSDRNDWEYDVMRPRLKSESTGTQIRLSTWPAFLLLSRHYLSLDKLFLHVIRILPVARNNEHGAVDLKAVHIILLGLSVICSTQNNKLIIQDTHTKQNIAQLPSYPMFFRDNDSRKQLK